jgi:uncharacterized membrane protein
MPIANSLLAYNVLTSIEWCLVELLVAFVRPQLFFCKRVHWSKSKMEPAANTVAVIAFEIYLASAAVSQAFLVWVLYPASVWDKPNA